MRKIVNPKPITEAQLSKQIQDFLSIDGWRTFRMEPLSNVIQRRYSAELGCPDLLALRYGKCSMSKWGEILWLEIKRPGAKPKKHQEAWHAEERMLGAEVQVIDDYDKFREWYASSGLNRRIRS